MKRFAGFGDQKSFIHSAILVRAQAIRDLNGYNENYRYAQDYELWTRLLSKSKCHNLVDAICKDQCGAK